MVALDDEHAAPLQLNDGHEPSSVGLLRPRGHLAPLPGDGGADPTTGRVRGLVLSGTSQAMCLGSGWSIFNLACFSHCYQQRLTNSLTFILVIEVSWKV